MNDADDDDGDNDQDSYHSKSSFFAASNTAH